MSDALAFLVENLSEGSRRARQVSATRLAQIAKEQPESLVDYCDDFIDALNRPEAQTRWECLDILTCLLSLDSCSCEKAVSGAEAALFDEESGALRLAAMRFLCALGSTSEDRSTKVWPLIDEAIQCYHGDLEFPDMLNAVIEFSEGNLDESVRAALTERMSFDAKSGKGSLKRRAQQILDNTSK